MHEPEMTKLIIYFFLLFTTSVSFSQRLEVHLELLKYYPALNIDSNAIYFQANDLNDFLSNLDTNGNEIYKRLVENRYRRLYFIAGDTIKSLRYNFKTREFVSLEVFAYNQNQQIVRYIDCSDYYFDKQKIYVQIEDFFYDEQKRIIDKLVYYNYHYHDPIYPNSSFNLEDFKLTNAIHYSYRNNKDQTIVFAKECMGKENFRSFDTIIINRKGYIVRFNSFAKQRALGCPMGLHVNDIFDYKYHSDSVETKYIQIKCMGTDKNGVCVSYDDPVIHITNSKVDKYELNYFGIISLRNNRLKFKKQLLVN